MPATTANRIENAKPASADRGAAKEAPAAPAPAPERSGLKPFIPLIANLVLMPVLAYLMTAFVLVAKLAKKVGEPAAAESAPAAPGGASQTEIDSAGGTITSGGKVKYSAPLSKTTLVNVSGTMGTRDLLAEVILVGNSPN